MSQEFQGKIGTEKRFGFLRQIGRFYAWLGQAYFGIGTVMVLIRMLTALTGRSVHGGVGGWFLDAVLYFFFWPALVLRFGLTGPMEF